MGVCPSGLCQPGCYLHTFLTIQYSTSQKVTLYQYLLHGAASTSILSVSYSPSWPRTSSDVISYALFALTVYIPGGHYDYLSLSGRRHVERLSCDWTDRNTLSHIQVKLPFPVATTVILCVGGMIKNCKTWLPVSPQSENRVDQRARVINSVLEGDVAVAAGAVVQHCHLQVRGSVSKYSVKVSRTTVRTHRFYLYMPHFYLT